MYVIYIVIANQVIIIVTIYEVYLMCTQQFIRWCVLLDDYVTYWSNGGYFSHTFSKISAHIARPVILIVSLDTHRKGPHKSYTLTIYNVINK